MLFRRNEKDWIHDLGGRIERVNVAIPLLKYHCIRRLELAYKSIQHLIEEGRVLVHDDDDENILAESKNSDSIFGNSFNEAFCRIRFVAYIDAFERGDMSQIEGTKRLERWN